MIGAEPADNNGEATRGPTVSTATALDEACHVRGLDPTGASLISHSSNAVYLLPTAAVVARVTTGHGAPSRVARTQELIRWLTRHDFPASAPMPGVDVVEIDQSTVVSFWVHYPQPTDREPGNSSDLAGILRRLHDLDEAPVDLAAWVPLESLAITVADPELSAALSNSERAWLADRVDQVRTQLTALDWPLGLGPIHGDAWAGNLLWDPSSERALLGDWDWTSWGPREVDLIPTWHATVRYQRPSSWAERFAAVYGYDLAGWAGYDLLMQMRDLAQLTGPIRRAPRSPAAATRLAQRLGCLQQGDRTTSWSMRPATAD